jgi:predicted RNase H-like HicB family nuclease
MTGKTLTQKDDSATDNEHKKNFLPFLFISYLGGQMKLTAIIEREGNGYVSLCPELDIASQGETIEQARDNLQEALELFFETASPEEVGLRLHEDLFVTQVEVALG